MKTNNAKRVLILIMAMVLAIRYSPVSGEEKHTVVWDFDPSTVRAMEGFTERHHYDR